LVKGRELEAGQLERRRELEEGLGARGDGGGGGGGGGPPLAGRSSCSGLPVLLSGMPAWIVCVFCVGGREERAAVRRRKKRGKKKETKEEVEVERKNSSA